MIHTFEYPAKQRHVTPIEIKRKMKFEVVARTRIKFVSIFCGASSENQNYFDILQTVLSLYVWEQLSVRVRTVLPNNHKNGRLDGLVWSWRGSLKFVLQTALYCCCDEETQGCMKRMVWTFSFNASMVNFSDKLCVM